LSKVKEIFSPALLTVKLAACWPSSFNIFIMKTFNQIVLSTKQLKAICATLKKRTPCRLLVFGLGNDSLFWLTLNRDGLTVFIEDDKNWFEKITKKSKGIKAFLVHYGTQRKDWKKLLENTSLLKTILPDDIEKEEWDIILVDGPKGWGDETPGRMKSIFLASRLIGKSGEIFVHDCDREVEDAYCNKFLGENNLKMEYRDPIGFLRHYRAPFNQ
jgi:hypothetical protein